MNIPHRPLLSIIMLILVACSPLKDQDSNRHTSLAFSIPSLLDRPAGLGTEEEQKYVNDSYHRLSEMIKNHPENLEAYFKLAQLFMLEARVSGEHGHYFPAALKVIDHALEDAERTEELFEANFLKASVLLSLHQFDKALPYGKKAIQYNPYNALAYGALVDAYVELGQYEEAVKMADKMVTIRPDLRSYARISYLREIHGDVEGSIEAMKMAIEAGYPGYEDKAWCRLTLGNLYEAYGDLPNAELQYQLAMQERENYPFAIAALAGIEATQGKYQQAITLLDSAATIIPEVGFYESKADLLLKMGKKPASDTIIKEVILMLEDDEAHGHNMGLAYASIYQDFLGDYASAMKRATHEYNMRPENIETNMAMAGLYYDMGEYQNARQHMTKAMRTNSQQPKLLCLAGLIAYKSGDKQKGEKLIKRSLSYNPYQDHSWAVEAKRLIQ